MEPKPDTVEELLATVRRLLDDERARGQGLDSKTSSLAGFTGAILAITAGLGGEFFRADLGAVGDPLLRVLYVIAVGALAASAIMAVLSGLTPQQRLAITMQEIRSFAEYPIIASERVDFQGRMLLTLTDAVGYERAVNDRKARRAKHAALALVVGFVGVAAEALTVAIVG